MSSQQPHAARIYVERVCWPIFPCHFPRGSGCSCGKPDCDRVAKHPLTLNGRNDATLDLRQIKRWWERWPDANPALATGRESGVAVLDVDDGGDETLFALEAEHGPLPATPTSTTGGGGAHCFFEMPQGVRVPSRVKFQPGLDMRATGAYVLLPPSRHASGGEYTWNADAHVLDIALAPMPAWLIELLAAKSGNGLATTKFATPIYEGTRHSTLMQIGGWCRRIGMSEPAILAALIAENNERCRPPLTDLDELRNMASYLADRAPGFVATTGGLFQTLSTSSPAGSSR